MNNILLRFTLVSLLLLSMGVILTGCGEDEKKDTPAQDKALPGLKDVTSDDERTGLTRVEIPVAAPSEQAASGKAVLIAKTLESTNVVISLENAPDKAQAASIYQGYCNFLEDELVKLEAVENGSSVTEINEPLKDIILSEELISVNVGPKDAPVACTQLSLGAEQKPAEADQPPTTSAPGTGTRIEEADSDE